MKPCWAAVLAFAMVIPQTFKMSVDAVRVDVLVLEGNRPIIGLTADDFELRDRDVVQEVSSVTTEEVPLRVTLVLDASTSVQGEALEHLKNAATDLMRFLTPTDRVALLRFTAGLELPVAWTTNRPRVIQAIGLTKAGGGTALHDAVYAALTLRDGGPDRSLILVLSDGTDSSSWLPAQMVIDAARRNDAVVYAAVLNADDRQPPDYRLDFRSGIQLPPPHPRAFTRPESFLRILAHETGGGVFNAQRSERLRDAFVQIIQEFRHRYVLSYVPRGVSSGGWHPIQVKVKGRRYSVTARRGYLY